MPTPQLITGAIETAINQALQLSNTESLESAGLSGKRMVLHIQEAQMTLALHFSANYIDVGAQSDWSQLEKESIDNESVYVSLSLSAISDLREMSKLTSLIKQGKLDFYGDLNILQKVSKWFESIDFDIEDVLANYIGDAPAYWVNSQAKSVAETLKALHERSMSTLANYALEEKPVAVRKIQVINFSDEVNALRADTARLEARLEQLEKKLS